MTNPLVLIVDDEHAIREMLSFALSNAGFDTVTAVDTGEAQAALNQRLPDVILLDWMLPGMSGVEFARRIKEDSQICTIPVIMLTAKADENDKIKGLDGGADDYITKPFSTRELLSRIKAVLRRSNPHADEVLQVEGLKVDTGRHRVKIDDNPIELGPTEYRLLTFFMTHPERVYSRNQLLDHVWGSNVYVEERTVDVHIRRLRKLLEPFRYDRLIQTVRGAGYRFSAQP